MTFEEMEAAVQDARRTISQMDRRISVMADMCAGRLQSSGVKRYALEKLKRELSNYNMRTGQWKS